MADGTGAPLEHKDVLVEGDRILAVEQGLSVGDARVFDVTGLVVCPGFVNVLSQAHFSLQRDPRAEAELAQGVTTLVLGEGYSLGPVNDRARRHLAPQMPDDAQWAHPHLADGLHRLVAAGSSVNVASLVGHDNLRLGTIGPQARPARPDEIARMGQVLRAELEGGALGLGAAIMYAPSQFADTAEFESLARQVAEFDGVFAVHLRDEADRLLDSIREVIWIAERTGVRLHVYHLKVAGRANWGTSAAAIELLEQARARGLRIDGDVYPYVAGGSALLALIPQRFHADGIPRLLESLRAPATRAGILRSVAEGGAHQNLYRDCGGASGILLTVPVKPLAGLSLPITLADAAQALDTDPLELLADIIVSDPTTWAVYFLGRQDDLEAFLCRSWTSVCSDASSGSSDHQVAQEDIHPRGYGSFARILSHYVRERNLLSLPEAVRKMTQLPASTFGLGDRGVVRPGAIADLAVFDPMTVDDRASYAQPRALAAGVHLVFVAGRIAWEHGHRQGADVGQVLNRSR